MKLVWDYETGFIIDIETGEIVDTIFDYTFVGRSADGHRVGSKMTDEEKMLIKGTEIVKELKRKGLSDVRGTFVEYKLGLTTKSVKSLKSNNVNLNIPEDMKEEIGKCLKKIERDPVLSARPERSKLLMAIACISIIRGMSLRGVSKSVGVSEKTLRKLLKIVRERLIYT